MCYARKQELFFVSDICCPDSHGFTHPSDTTVSVLQITKYVSVSEFFELVNQTLIHWCFTYYSRVFLFVFGY